MSPERLDAQGRERPLDRLGRTPVAPEDAFDRHDGHVAWQPGQEVGREVPGGEPLVAGAGPGETLDALDVRTPPAPQQGAEVNRARLDEVLCQCA